MRDAAALAALLCCSAAAPAAEALRNWFDDPFFAIASGLRDCPLPAGPFVTESDSRQQAHHRAEKGTSCWLAGQCERPNAFAYDAGIAQALQARLAAHNPFAAASLWATVQARVVYVEGCTRDAALAARVEAFVREVPQVQQVVVIVATKPGQPPPYRVRLPGVSR